MPNNFTQLGVADYNQQFLDALEFVDNVIQNRQHMQVSVWRSMIPRAAFTLGEGLVKKAYRFHPGVGDQRGLQRWRPIQISRVAAGEDPGVDACAYNPYLVDYGFESVNYTGFQTERRTKHICVRDIRFTWQFKQQLNLIMGYLGDITNSVWENYAREEYLKFSADNTKAYVLSDGTPTSTAFTYDPFSTDTDGDNTVTIDSGLRVSTLNWSYMRWYLRWLQMQAPMAAIGNANGMPLFGLVCDLEDIDRMIENDPELREDYRFASPMVNIQNYGQVKSFKGFTLMHDMAAPRFAVKSDDGTTVTLKRVDPLVESTATTIGNRVDVNPDYLNAEFALGVIFMKNIFQIEVPPAGPTAPGGGTSFGATPSLNGEFKWLNIQDKEDNLLQENGFYFGRYEAFAKPLVYNEEPITFLYRRCPHSVYDSCEIGGDDAVGSPVTGSTSATAVAGSTVLFSVALANIMEREPPQTVTIQVDGGSSYSVMIADASAAPTYIMAAQSAADATAIIAGSTYSVSW